MMKAAGWDLDAAANAIEPDVVYTRRAHKGRVARRQVQDAPQAGLPLQPSLHQGRHTDSGQSRSVAEEKPKEAAPQLAPRARQRGSLKAIVSKGIGK